MRNVCAFHELSRQTCLGPATGDTRAGRSALAKPNVFVIVKQRSLTPSFFHP